MGRKVMDKAQADPKGLIREGYAIEGITPGDCRSIFLDWALSLAPGIDPAEAMRALVVHYAEAAPDHPMSRVIADGLAGTAQPKRRGGRAGRAAERGA